MPACPPPSRDRSSCSAALVSAHVLHSPWSLRPLFLPVSISKAKFRVASSLNSPLSPPIQSLPEPMPVLDLLEWVCAGSPPAPELHLPHLYL